MKKTFVLLAALFIGATSFAQHQVNAGVELGLPSGDFGETQGIGFGVSGKYLYNMNDNSAITGTVGFLSFGGKDVSGVKFPSVSAIGFKGGYRYAFAGSENGFYVEPQLGFTSFSGGGASQSGFTFAFGAGYKVSKFDIGARYESTSVSGGSLPFIGIGASYTLMGGK